MTSTQAIPLLQPKERPILFQGAMVRALLAGTKTQTRRLINGDLTDEARLHIGMYHPTVIDRHGEEQPGLEVFGAWTSDGEWAMKCPYGQPGDRLWVRESWMPDPPIDDTWASTQWAGCSIGKIAGVPERFRSPEFCNYAASWAHGPVKWTPSIHMPRWASRIMLEVTGVRVERLRDISEEDAHAEGIENLSLVVEEYGIGDDLRAATARLAYSKLWDSINGKTPGAAWADNPWVWVVAFRKLTP